MLTLHTLFPVMVIEVDIYYELKVNNANQYNITINLKKGIF